MRSHLSTIIETIERPTEADGLRHFSVAPIPEAQNHYVGRDARNAPCVLLRSSDAGLRAPLQLSGLEIHYAVPCRIWLANNDGREETLTVVVCTTADVRVQSYFLHLMETVLRIVGSAPTLATIVDAVRNLVEILQHLGQPPRRNALGLFGELLVILMSSDPVTSIHAWRSGLDDRFDFSIGDARLEVKATSGRTRAHFFSLDQCQPPPNATGVLASLLLEENGGGKSLGELVEDVIGKVGGSATATVKVQRTVAETLGRSITEALALRFDFELGCGSLKIFDLRSIPAIRTGIPAGVSQVRFSSDLSNIEPVSRAALRQLTPSLWPLLPGSLSISAQ